MIFENGKEITRICENGKDIIARYCEGHLLWSSGIKLKSLLGKQNTEQSITLSSPLNLNTAVGFGMSGNGITYPNNLWGGSYGKPIEIKETHYYLYAIKVNKNVLSTANTWGGFYFATQGGYIDNQTMAYTDGEWYLGIQKANKSLINDNFFGIFARSLALNTGDIITCYKSFILDLTQAKLDTLTAEQVYNLITLNGTDFTNIELLSAGYEIKLGSFKSQETNTVDLGTLNWFYNSTYKRFYCELANLKNNPSTSDIANLTITDSTYKVGNLFDTLESSTSDKAIAVYSNKLYIKNVNFTDVSSLTNSLIGTKLTYELANKNNIAGSKYGFVKVKDIPTWTYETSIWGGTFRATSLNSIGFYSKGSYSEKDNLFINGLQNMSRATLSTSTNGISAQPQIIFIKDSSCLSVDDLLAKYGEEYIVFELEHSFGNKLDNYTAEQVYYMFFATLGMSKMYVPYGRKFESAGDVIIGTKYGIFQFNGTETFTFDEQLSSGLYRYYTQVADYYYSKVQIDTSGLGCVDGYCDKLPVYNGVYNQQDYESIRFGQRNNAIYLCFKEQKTQKQIQDFLKGSFVIFPLATPNGTDYNDLTAKQMYDMLNTNKIDVIADGKSVNGVRSVVGKQNNLIKGTNQWYFTSGGCFNTNLNGYNTPVISGHRYFVFSDITTTETMNYISFRNSGYSNIGASSNNGSSQYQSTGICCACFNATANDNLHAIGFHGLTPNNSNCSNLILIDLTEHNLQNLTAQEAYQYFKENNLFNLSTTGVINIGGLKK